MRYGIITSNGVRLTSGSTPLPEGAIEPIPNWDDIVGVPECYLKYSEGQILEKTQAEKDAWDEAHPPSLEELQLQAQEDLDTTDWYITRFVDPSSEVEVPVEILTLRAEAREIL